MEGQAPSAEEIVARRVAIVQAALAEVGEPSPVWVYDERAMGGLAFGWYRGDPKMLARATTLALMAHPDDRFKGITCYPCWSRANFRGDVARRNGCEMVTPLERLRFIPCRTAQARAGSAT